MGVGARAAMLALLRRNWKLLVQRRSALAVALELLLPVAGLLALGVWKTLAPDLDVPDGWSTLPLVADMNGDLAAALLDSVFDDPLPTASDSQSLFAGVGKGEPLFLVQETSMPGLLVSLVANAVQEALEDDDEQGWNATQCGFDMLVDGRVSNNASAENSLSLSCAGLLAPHRIAIVPDVPFTRQYLFSTLSAWHPPITFKQFADNDTSNSTTMVIPGIEDVVMFFDDESALDTYVTSERYGRNASRPKIHAALVFLEYPQDETAFGSDSESVEYAIRLSVTAGNAVATAPIDGQERQQLWDPLRDHQVRTQEYKTYALEGFSTLQSLVVRFLNCRPAWNSANKTLASGNVTSQVQCSQSGSVANGDNETARSFDDRLLSVLQGDAKLNSSWELMRSVMSDVNNATEIPAFNMSAISAAFDSDIELESLLAPMRVAPQAYSGSRFVPMAVSAIHSSAFYRRIRRVFSLIVTFSYLFTVAKMITVHIGEAESLAREYFRVIGVLDRYDVISWYAAYGLILTLVAAMQLLVVSIFGIFSSSSVFLVFALLCLYAWSLWCFAFLMSAFFSNARAGAYVGVFVLSIFLFLEERLLAHCVWGANLFASLAAARGFRALVAAESVRRGISWGNIDEVFGGDALGQSLSYLLFDCFLYTLLGLYFDRVVPKESSHEGVSQSRDPWYFPLLPSFWRCWLPCGRRNAEDDINKPNSYNGRGPASVPASMIMAAYGSSRQAMQDGLDVIGSQNMSDPPTGTQVDLASSLRTSLGTSLGPSSTPSGAVMVQPSRDDASANVLCLQRVSASVPTLEGEKTILNGINLRLLATNISCIFAPPGAGKSTLMSVLTLRSALHSGSITLGNLSWQDHASAVRDVISCCFQENVLFGELTVLDHMEFYAHLKLDGAHSTSTAQHEIESQLRKFDLSHVRDVKAKRLANGTRRKLAIAIALIAKSDRCRFVFLDEPTRGMDPYSRHRTWEILRRSSEHHGIVVATSDADEAEAIGDVVEVLTSGKVTSFGSAVRLKERFRAGYSLLFAKGPRFQEREIMELITSLCVHGVVQVDGNSPDEFLVCIPAENSSAFPQLFQRLETQYSTVYGAESYKLSMATLDDVLSKVVDHLASRVASSDNDLLASIHRPVSRHDDVEVGIDVDVEAIHNERDESDLLSHGRHRAGLIAGEVSVIASQMSALIRQRLTLLLIRGRTATISLILVPVLALIVFMTAIGAFSDNVASPRLELTPTQLSSDVRDVGDIHLPFYCMVQTSILPQNETTQWCRDVFSNTEWDDASTTPRDVTLYGYSSELFGVDYSNYMAPNSTPVANDTNSDLSTAWEENTALLQLTSQLYSTGFVSQDPVSNQFGAFSVLSSQDDNVFSFDVVVNTSVPHAAGLFKAQMDQALYRSLTGDSSLSLIVHNYPLPLSAQEGLVAKMDREGVTTNAFLVAVAFSFLPATIVWRLAFSRSFPRNEKHQLLLSGMKVAAFWLSNYLVDVAVHMTSATMFVLILLGFNVSTWEDSKVQTDEDSDHKDANPFGALVVLLFLFGCAVYPFAYALSFWFRDASKIRLAHIHSFVLFAVLSYSLFIAAGPVERAGRGVDEAFQNLFSFIPQFALAFGLRLIASGRQSAVESDPDGEGPNPFAGSISGVSILYLSVTAVLYLAVVVVLDNAMMFPQVFAYFSKSPYVAGDVDADNDSSLDEFADSRVRDEAKRVMATLNPPRRQADAQTTVSEVMTEDAEAAVIVHQVAKVFRVDMPRRQLDLRRLQCCRRRQPDEQVLNVATQPISFRVDRGECLALLGAQDSGKTTLMRILSGELLPSSGRVVISGRDAIWSQRELRENRSVGYCSQRDDFLQDALNSRDHIALHARLKGLASSALEYDKVVDDALSLFRLARVQHRLAGALLPGERRRLCLALATLGNPDVLLLDEPTYGLDGKMRQRMWQVLRNMVTSGAVRAMVVVSSSLDECSALGTRVGILVDGSLTYLGSYEALERDFDYGWVLDANVAFPTSGEMSRLSSLGFASSTDEVVESSSVVTSAELPSLCGKLGHADWIERIRPDHPTGCWLARSLAVDGAITAPELLQWWIGELRYDALASSIEETFGGDEYVRLLRREPATCRFQLLLEDNQLKLSQVFKLLESSKQRGTIESYAVSPASFETVVDTFEQTARAKQQLRHSGPVASRRGGGSGSGSDFNSQL